MLARLGLTDRQYLEWLRLLFILLMQMREGQPNLFEAIMTTLVEDGKTYVTAFVFESTKTAASYPTGD